MLRIFFALWLAITPAFSWAGSMSLLGVGKPSAAAPAFGYTLLGAKNPDTSAVSTVLTVPFAMGTVANNSLLVVGHIVENNEAIVSMIYDPGGANVSLSQQVIDGSAITAIYSGVIPSGSGTKNLQITYATSVAFVSIAVTEWLITGQTHNSAQSTGTVVGSSFSIAATSGEILFAVSHNSSDTYSGSTPTVPSRVTVGSPNTYGAFADWSSVSTASYSVAGGSFTFQCGATFN